MGIRLVQSEFGKSALRTINGGRDKVKQFTWESESGLTISVISYGAIVQAIKVPDKHGVVADVTLGFDDLEGYMNRNDQHFGSTVGRCANRIGGASFVIDGETFELAKNVNGKDHLHGGIIGFDKHNWESTVIGNKVIFSYHSKDGEEGYPGDLIVNVIYELKEDDSFHVEFLATTTKKTVVNLTNHSYFNLAGHDTGSEELYKHEITINADKITETKGYIPTGKFIPVGGTPYDLRIATNIGDAVNKFQVLYDDNFCVNTYDKRDKDLTFVSRATHPPSGRYLEIHSNQPGVQLYISNSLPAPNEPALVGKNGVGYRKHGAFCLETQNYPDAVHHDNFPRGVLYPGEVYKHQVIYRFGAEKSQQHFVTSV